MNPITSQKGGNLKWKHRHQVVKSGVLSFFFFIAAAVENKTMWRLRVSQQLTFTCQTSKVLMKVPDLPSCFCKILLLYAVLPNHSWCTSKFYIRFQQKYIPNAATLINKRTERRYKALYCWKELQIDVTVHWNIVTLFSYCHLTPHHCTNTDYSCS